MFPCCEGYGDLSGYLKTGEIFECTVDKNTRDMRLRAKFSAFVPPVYISETEKIISGEFSLSNCKILPVLPEKTKEAEKKSGEKPGAVKPIFGKMPKGDPVPIESLTLDSGRVTIQGHIFAPAP